MKVITILLATAGLFACGSSYQRDIGGRSMDGDRLPSALSSEAEKLRIRQERRQNINATLPKVVVPISAPWLLETFAAGYSGVDAIVALKQIVPDGLVNFSGAGLSGVEVKSSRNSINRKDHIDSICAQANLFCEVRGSILEVSEYRTKTFDVLVPAGQHSARVATGSLSSSGGGAASTGGLTNVLLVQGNSLNDVSLAISAVLGISPDSAGGEQKAGDSVSVINGSGQIVVKTTKDKMSRVEKVIEQFNESTGRRVQIEFVMYAIDVSDTEQRNLDVTLIRDAAINGGFAFSGVQATGSGNGQISLNFGEGNRIDGSNVILGWLQRLGNTEMTARKKVIAQNQQVVTLRDVETTRYVSQVSIQRQSSGNTDTNSPTVQISELNVGESWSVVPSVGVDRVYLKFAVSRAALVGFDDYSFDNGSIAGRLPQSAEDEIAIPITLLDGETRLITNLSDSRESITTSQPSFFKFLPWLSNKTASKRKIESVVAVTANIL